MKTCTLLIAATALALTATACESSIRPLRPVERVEVWVPDDSAPATAPATSASTEPTTATTTSSQPAATLADTAPATRPGHIEIRVVDPNQAARFIYKATYDNIWQQAIWIINRTGFVLDRQDYRLGVLTTQPLPSAQIIEFWKPQLANAKDAAENIINSQRRTIRLTISAVPGKPEFYEIGVQVLVERQTNPSEIIGGPVFVEGSGFGRNAITLHSDFATTTTEGARWVVLGHDPDLEKKLIDALFLRI